jgi:EpsG family
MEARNRTSHSSPSLALFVVLLAFAALRFEIAFDWIVYESVFDRLPDPIEAIQNGVPNLNPPMEPLFVGLNIATKSFTTHVTVLFVIVVLIRLRQSTTSQAVYRVRNLLFGWSISGWHFAVRPESGQDSSVGNAASRSVTLG